MCVLCKRVCVCVRCSDRVCVLRRRVCGRKRKGTPVKVCDRAVYVTEDEEESLSEHSYSPGTETLIYFIILIVQS